MAITTNIQWTQATWNPWHGCVKISDACKFCYMYRDKERYGLDPKIVVKSKTKFKDPLKWKEPKIIFTCSWSDWFIKDADEWRDQAWKIIKESPQHTFQILTKRPELILDRLPSDWGRGYENVWLGVSVENQETADNRIPLLAQAPAKVKFLSVEPILTEINLIQYLPYVDLCIIGGESGNDKGKYSYREAKIEWFTKIVDDCKIWNTNVFVKQLGTHLAKSMKLKDRHGANIDEFPEELKIRQMPI